MTAKYHEPWMERKQPEKKLMHVNEMYRAKTERTIKKNQTTSATAMRVTTKICDGYNENKILHMTQHALHELRRENKNKAAKDFLKSASH